MVIEYPKPWPRKMTSHAESRPALQGVSKKHFKSYPKVKPVINLLQPVKASLLPLLFDFVWGNCGPCPYSVFLYMFHSHNWIHKLDKHILISYVLYTCFRWHFPKLFEFWIYLSKYYIRHPYWMGSVWFLPLLTQYQSKYYNLNEGREFANF